MADPQKTNLTFHKTVITNAFPVNLYIKAICILALSTTSIAQTPCPLLLSTTPINKITLSRQFLPDQKPRVLFVGENHGNPVYNNAAIFRSLIPNFERTTHFLLEGPVLNTDEIADVVYNSTFTSWDNRYLVERARDLLHRYYRAIYEFVPILVNQEKILKMFHESGTLESLRLYPPYEYFFWLKEILEKGLGREWEIFVVERDDWLKINLRKKILKIPKDELVVVLCGKFHISYYVPAYGYLEKNNIPYAVYLLEEPPGYFYSGSNNEGILTAFKQVWRFSTQDLAEFDAKLNKAREILKALDWKIDLE